MNGLWRALVVLFLALGFLLPAGCGSEDSGGGGGGPSAPVGRGTPACNQWQQALCDWAGRCNPPAESVCNAQAPGVQCTSDQAAQSCAEQLNASDCSTLPVGCDLFDLADPVPAIQACNDFIEALCTRSEECQPGSHDACVADLTSTVDCSTAIGFKLSYEQCLSQIRTLDCAATQSPTSCQGVIVTG
jgi:hypothetical protein